MIINNEELLHDNIQSKDIKISKVLVLQFCMLITNYTFKHIFQIHDGRIRAAVSLIFMIIVGVLFLKAFPIVLRRCKLLILISLGITCFIFLLTSLMFRQNNKYLLEIAFSFFFMIIPCFVYYLSIYDKNVFLNMLVHSAYYQIVLSIIFFLTRSIALDEYDMVYSYLTLVPVILLIYKIFNNYKLIDLILAIIGIVSILGMGSRGPLLAIIIFIIIYPLISFFKGNKGKHSIKLLLIILTIIIIFIIFTFNIEYILKFTNRFFINKEINSRTLTIALNIKKVDFLAGRYEIYTYMIENIIKNPIIGYGIGGDRVLLNGTYSHNLFFEILIDFGMCIGIIIIMIIIIISINGLFNNNKIKRDLAIIFFSIGVVQLLISGSYLTSVNFWVYIAICICPVSKI